MKLTRKHRDRISTILMWVFLVSAGLVAIDCINDGNWSKFAWVVSAILWCLNTMLQESINRLNDELLDMYRKQNAELVSIITNAANKLGGTC